jgi:hypothetical protein
MNEAGACVAFVDPIPHARVTKAAEEHDGFLRWPLV